ncbi:MAG TPA: endonuclease/exonuclease/phosphatase family protein, partial [Chitinophagales bacterium]|nr:endonuclease/exonuclease/phosphatase family protein [Chitinophagales bacterium]
MLRLVLLICLVIPLVSVAQIRVLTYNIRNSHAQDGVNSWNKRKATLAALIKKIDPDILGTQEVLPDQLKYLNSTLAGYISFGAGRNNGKHAGEHSAIFYKSDKYEQVEGGNFWLSQTPGVPGSKSW